MKRSLTAVAAACALALAGCGAGHHQTAGGSVHPAGWGQPLSAVSLTPQVAAPQPTAEMFDSVTVSQIPAGPRAVAGYTAGLFPTYPVLLRAFPHATVKSIAIAVRWHAQCLDVEPGDATPGEVVAWVRADRAAGFARPCVYSSIWEYVHEIRPLLAAAHVSRSSIFEWDADYTNVQHLDAGFDATQWTSHAMGRNLDESTATLAFLGIHPAPLPVCIHHREAKGACVTAKARIASDNRAAASSHRAYIARGCVTLAQRDSWFAAQLRRHPKVKSASRRRALAASQAAYRQRNCSVFANRVRSFSAHATAIERSN